MIDNKRDHGKQITWILLVSTFTIFLINNIHQSFQLVINSDFRTIFKSPVSNQLDSGHPFTRAIFYVSRFEQPKSQRIAIIVPDSFANRDQQSLIFFWASYWFFPKTPILYSNINEALVNNEVTILIYGSGGINNLQNYTLKTLPYNSFLATKEIQ